MLEDMFRACLIDFGGYWDKFLPLCEFSYDNSHHSSIHMTLFEALCGKESRSRYSKDGDVKFLGVDLVKNAQER